MQSTVNKPNWVQWITVVVVIAALCFAYSANANVKDIDVPANVDYTKIATIVATLQQNIKVPSASEIASLVSIPDVESANNELLNEYLENEFSDNYTAIKVAAEEFALEELEDDDYEVIVDYIKALVEGLDEDSVEVDVDDVEVTVTKLGLEEDEDKSAIVEFEIDVEYTKEEGVVEDYKKSLVVIYNVVFDEGDLDDESVDLVSIQ